MLCKKWGITLAEGAGGGMNALILPNSETLQKLCISSNWQLTTTELLGLHDGEY